ncbi:unnamed protein product [Periconia digitata]|uniref:Enoyl reductase (ER) domain-containing protein n=1 Tax=Periconia digitata TaxID=1303443 RepID=A0A9W4U7C9_9PLEO|nr:unnamed protein product [Periconia digitata]
MSTNKAAFLKSLKTPFSVDDAPLHSPGPHEILIRNRAIAVNPIDYKQQDIGFFIKSYPWILGMDVAGIVEEVGADITTFKKGDRVAALAPGMPTGNQAYAAFQLYTVVPASVASKIPDRIAFTDAAVLPLGLTTVCWGLFGEGYLELDPPSASGTPSTKNNNKVVLVWGGSSSVGSCALQLLSAGGYTILTTASAKNFDFVKELGATQVFDHHDPDIVKKLVDAARGKEILGAYDTISTAQTVRACGEYLHELGGGRFTKVDRTVDASDLPASVTVTENQPPGLRGPDGGLASWNRLWREFMGEGLENGKLKTKPNAFVLKGGLEKLNEAVDLVRQGVSAKKVVVQVVDGS